MAGKKRERCLMRTQKRHHHSRDLTGMVHGYATALNYAGSDGKSGYWDIQCVCGTVFTVVSSDFARGNYQSCGCKTKTLIVKANTKHGHARHELYGVWRGMVARCHAPSHRAYKNYGARGITVCDAWRTFTNFWEDRAPSWKKGLTLERLDNNGPYCKANCAWETYTHQARNTRQNREIDTPMGRLLVCEASELSGIGETTLLYRVSAGWPVQHLFDPPGSWRRRV